MVADFSGYASKNDIRCSDGRTIKAGAFKHLDKKRVPLVWQHQHNDPDNVLGYAILEHRADGVYTFGYFNDTPSGNRARSLVKHGDVEALSIYANNLTQRGGDVLHGEIREVSLVLSGANPGAVIDNINIQHSEDADNVEAIIYTGLELEHEDGPGEGAMATDTAQDTKTVKDVFDSMNEEQQNVVYYLLGEAISDEDADDSEKEPAVQHTALDTDQIDTLRHGIAEDVINHFKENDMTRNVFDQTDEANGKPRATLTHSQIKTILDDAQKPGSTLKDSFLAHAQEYGIQDIDILFPDAKLVTSSPELIARRMEWVAEVIDGTKHSPFARIKSTAADLTADEARAKGYVKGNKKKEEIIKLLKRVTTPTTVYKKQKLDRDDVVDITELDIVAWLKAEMRLMLDEELARAILIGDGREPDDEDKIDEDHVRPIAYDDDMYAHKVNLASNASPEDITESIIRARTFYKGTGTPTLFTTDAIIIDLLLQKDKVGRRLYDSIEQLASVLRVRKIVPVEAMESQPELLAIIVNLADYTVGADKGGQVSMFDDFDIDYNQLKYLIETRISGALTKPKSAVVVKRAAGTVVTPTQPSYNSTTHVITIPTQTGVVYSINGSPVTGTVTISETTDVEAAPASGYSFPHNTDADWSFVYTA